MQPIDKLVSIRSHNIHKRMMVEMKTVRDTRAMIWVEVVPEIQYVASVLATQSNDAIEHQNQACAIEV